MQTAEEDIKKKLVSAAKKSQQIFYELLSDWNSYDQNRPQCLKNFIGIALYGPPKIDDLIANKSFSSAKNFEDEIFFHDPHQQIRIHKIYEKIVRHGTQNTRKREIMCGLIYNVTFDGSIENGKCFTEENLIECLQAVPIFKVLKNVVKKCQNGKIMTRKCVTYYIDDSERVYKNWNDYLRNNVLPECIMVLPKEGEYQGDERRQWSEKMSYVGIEIYESPACKAKMVNTIDPINKFVSLGCAGIGVAAAFNPVGAPIMALSAVGMGLSGLWSISKSSHELADRHLHEQSISVNSKNGFIRWFGLASGALAVVSSEGSMLLSKTIQNGSSLSNVARVAHGSMQIGSLATSGVNVGLMKNNKSASLLEKRVSAQEALNLVARFLLFTNALVDLQTTKNIIEKKQFHVIRDFERSLRESRHRKEFCRMVKNNISTSTISDNEQIIRSTIKISDEDLLSASIMKNEKLFFFEGVTISPSDGSIIIDGKNLMKPRDFVKKFKKKASGIQPIAIALNTNFSIKDNIFEKVLRNFLARYKMELKNSKPNLTQFTSFLNGVSEIGKPDVIFEKLLLISIKLVRKIREEIYLVNNILPDTVNFLWDFIQINLRDKVGPSRKSENYREFLMKIIIGIHKSVENNVNDWLDSFQDYLKINLKLMRQKTRNDKKGKLYLLQVM